jgi:spermidine synthase
MVLLGVAFFLSGAAALVYQVVWQRILTLHTGIGVVSVSLIVAAFMAGLGLGSHVGGVLSARVSPGRALRLFALIELAVGLFAAVSCHLYYDGLGALAAVLYRTTAGTAVAHFAAFLLPTALMGMSLPFLVRATVRETASAPRVIGLLYGVNVLGAAAGALVAPWFLMRFLGMEGAALVGTAANLTAGLAALAVGTARPAAAGADAPAPGPAPRPSGEGRFGLWLGLYALSGFLALSLEVLWFRLIDVGVKSTAYTFGTVLCIYLLGLGAGSLVGGRRASRLERPLAAFLDYQVALLACAGLAVALLAALPAGAPVYRWFFDYWRQDAFFQIGADWNAGALARLYALLPLLLYGAPTVLMGLSFGALQRAVQDDPATSGRKVGYLQAANIAGCAAGSILTGLVLLDRVGTAGALRLLLGTGLVVFLVVRAGTVGLSRGLLARVALAALVLAALPSNEDLWKRLHGVTVSSPPSFIGEDSSAVSVIVPGTDGRWRICVNGLPHSWLPYEGIHTLLGAVPAIVHPSPADVAVIGLGSGETAWAVACRPETRRVDVFEIAAAQAGLLRKAVMVAPFHDLRVLLNDPRVRMEAADGRQALLRTEARYDLIQIDAVHRTSAGSGNLYSLEFFRLCAGRLKPGGIVCSQKPGRRVGLTFAEAFPHALDFGNFMVGSNDPLPIDIAAWEARLKRAESVSFFTAAVAEGIRARLNEARPAWRNPAARIGLNSDLFPRDEFQTPAGWGN